MVETKLTVTVEEAAKILGIWRGLAYEAIRTGQIESVRIGRRILVPPAPLQKMLNADVPGTVR